MAKTGIFCLALAALLVACDRPAEQDRNHEAENADEAWGYEGEIGPEHWADLSSDFELCRTGVMQSPIDLTGATQVAGAGLRRERGTTLLSIDRRAYVMDLIDNGHTIQVTNDAPVSIDIDGEHFELVQYHFHAPSEHTVDGEHARLEAHFVTKSAQGNLAVVGVLVEEGEHDPFWDPLIDALPSGPEDPRHLEDLDFDVTRLQPLAQRYYRYEGSLTTPPCSEGVHWIIMDERLELSPAQLDAFDSRLHDNNRPVQSLGERELHSVGM